jgi:UDP-glucose 4-epimerase
MTNILVTGGSGFVGSALIKELVRSDCQILSIDNYFSGLKENEIESPNVHYVEVSTCDMLSNEEVMDFEPDTVYHLGEYSRIVQSFNDVRLCHNFNCVGTFNVLEYCKLKNAKLVYAGSSSKFGNDGADEHLSPYAWMKAKNAELINNYHNWWGLEFSIAYFYNVYGPGQICTGHMATVIGIFQEQYKAGKPITVVSPGDQRRDFTHIDDITRGLILVGEKGVGDGYLLGTGKNYTLLEIATAFGGEIQMLPARKGERFTSQAYPTKAKEELNWEAQRNVIDYIKSWTQEQNQQNSVQV